MSNPRDNPKVDLKNNELRPASRLIRSQPKSKTSSSAPRPKGIHGIPTLTAPLDIEKLINKYHLQPHIPIPRSEAARKYGVGEYPPQPHIPIPRSEAARKYGVGEYHPQPHIPIPRSEAARKYGVGEYHPQPHIPIPRSEAARKYGVGEYHPQPHIPIPRSEAARKYGVGGPMDEAYGPTDRAYYDYLQSKYDYLQSKYSKSKGMNMAEMIADPDGDSSSLCSACTIPIFSTPSISLSHKLFMHQQCADLSPHLLHQLHPDHTLHLINLLPTPTTAPTCTNCNRICGAIFYECPDCDFRLDLVCVLQIKILHRSHRHTMMVIRQREAASLTCSSCDDKHEPGPSSSSSSATLSYLCNLCSYWMHPDCATLPNAIVHCEDHKHPLFLTYNLPTDAPYSLYTCVICYTAPKKDSGVYICLTCSMHGNYLVHMKCAIKRHTRFKPVFIKEAKAVELCRLPLADENMSLIPYIREGSDEKHGHVETLHRHPLIFHKNDDDQSSRVCSVCTQFLSPPFFSCLQCPDFFVHSSCAHLPREITQSVHRHPIFLSPRAPGSDFSGVFSCKGCNLQCNGFAYHCMDCKFTLDIACAFINHAITHESHKNTHILFMCREIWFRRNGICNCCKSQLSGIWYECSICRDFKLHVRCALFPQTVRHAFDEHPLQLITADNGGDDEICEVCEQHLETKCWYYGCGECDQSFHIDCIPSVDRLSRIKLGSTVYVDGHGCALALTRQDDVVCRGNRCGFCGEIFKSSESDNGLAYECSICFFAIHHRCAKKRLLRTTVTTAPAHS